MRAEVEDYPCIRPKGQPWTGAKILGTCVSRRHGLVPCKTMHDLTMADQAFFDTVEAIYRRDGQRMWRAVLLYGGDPDVAEDAVAEAFAQLLRRGTGVREPERWLWRTAFKIAAGALKDRRRQVATVEDLERCDVGTDTLELVQALQRLSNHQRRAVLLHHVGGYSLEETARIIGSTRSAVSVHLVRGRRGLQRLLEG